MPEMSTIKKRNIAFFVLLRAFFFISGVCLRVCALRDNKAPCSDPVPKEKSVLFFRSDTQALYGVIILFCIFNPNGT